MSESVRVFLSTVSDEFRAYRDQLRGDLTRHNVEVKVQEHFKDLGGDEAGISDPAARLMNSLGLLFKAKARYAEAEPLMRRHVEIFLSFTARTGHQHPQLLASFANYTRLLVAMGRSKAKAIAAVDALARAHGVKL